MYGTMIGHKIGIAHINKNKLIPPARQRVCMSTTKVCKRRCSGIFSGAKRILDLCQFFPASRPEISVRSSSTLCSGSFFLFFGFDILATGERGVRMETSFSPLILSRKFSKRSVSSNSVSSNCSAYPERKDTVLEAVGSPLFMDDLRLCSRVSFDLDTSSMRVSSLESD